jgi:poly(A) polymerase
LGRNGSDDRQPFAEVAVAGLTLPDSGWRVEGLDRLGQALGSEQGLTRLVGGAVRDSLAGQPVKDIDLATQLKPDEVMTRLERAEIKVVPTGLAHGTVTAILRSGPVEITTLRRDVETDGRHATVAFSQDWQEDAARRDFTINALYADMESGEVFDYFGGIDDLKQGVVRFVGDAFFRIAEDHLRILRFFRFQARYGKGVPNLDSLAACRYRANDLMALSRERIADELLKILALPDPSEIISLMLDEAILRPVLPEIEADAAAHLARLVMREREAEIEPDKLRRLGCLLPEDPEIAIAVATRLKLSNAARKRLAGMAVAESDAREEDRPKALAYWVGKQTALDRLLLGDGDAAGLRDWEPPAFPISGGALIKRGLSAGPQVAALLKQVETLWVERGFPGDDELKLIADEVVKATLGAK